MNAFHSGRRLRRGAGAFALIAAVAAAVAARAETDTEPAPWWTAWKDPGLARWIERALTTHPTLDSASAAVQAARARRAMAAADARPAGRLELGGRLGQERTMRTDYATGDVLPVEAAAEVSWEIDLFRRIAARAAAAAAGAAAAAADRAAAGLALAAETALAYFDLSRVDAELPLAISQAAHARDRAGIIARRAAAGLVATYEASEAAAMAAEAERDVVALRRDREETIASAAALLGAAPDPAEGLDRIALPDVPDADSGRRILRRPDIVRIQALVESAGAAVRAQRAERLPTLSMIARAIGEGGRNGGGLTEWSAWIGPRLSLPVGDPRLGPAREMAEADLGVLTAEARSAMLTAAREIDSALARRRQAATDADAAGLGARHLRAAADAMARRAAAGLAHPLDAIAAEWRAWDAERTRLRSLHAAHAAHVGLLRALGG